MQLANLETSLKFNVGLDLNGTSNKNSGQTKVMFGAVYQNKLDSNNSTSKETKENYLSTQNKPRTFENAANDIKDNDNTEITRNESELNTNVNELESLEKETNIPSDIINEEAKAIIDEISNLLELDSDEVIEAMASLNMNVTDLFNLDKIKELMLSLNGEGEIALIVDGDFNDKLTDIVAFVKTKVEDLATDFEVSTTDLRESLETNKSVFEGIFLKEEEKTTTTTTNNLENQKSNMISNEELVTKTNLESVEDSLEKVIEEKTVINIEKNSTVDKDNSQSRQGSEDILNNKKENFSPNNIQNQNLVSDVYKNFANALESLEDTTINQVDVARQVIEQIKLTTSQNINQLEVMLNPENLGSVHVTVTAKEGIITAELTATNEAVKKALENQMQTLKENFNNQGIKVEAVSVTIESHSFEQNANLDGNNSKENLEQDKKKRMNLDLSSLDDLDFKELTADEIRAKDLIENGDASVSYLA